MFSSLFRSTNPTSDRADSASLLPWHAFDAAVERSLKLLRGAHIPVSFFAWQLGGHGEGEAAAIVGDALSPIGPVGRLADGGIGLLYLGPRRPESGGDAALEQHLQRRIESRLREGGWPGLANRIEFAAVHSWTDEVGHTADLVRALAWPPTHRRGSTGPPRRTP